MSYNGWSNYETWRVSLEMISDDEEMATWSQDQIKEFCYETLEEQGEGLCLDYANAFLSEVNWAEISEHLRDTYNVCQNCNETNIDENEDYCPECKEENKYSHYEKL